MGEVWKVGITQEKWDRLCHNNVQYELASAALIEDVLCGGVVRIYQGWDRPGQEDGYIYEGNPVRDFLRIGVEAPPPPGFVFLVWVKGNGLIDFWSWRRFDNEANRPEGVRGEIAWPNNIQK